MPRTLGVPTKRRMSLSSISAAPQQHPIQLLIAGDSRMDCQLLTTSFARCRSMFDICCATTHSEVLSRMNTHRPEVALVSEGLADGSLSGYRVLSDLRKTYPETRVIVLLRSDREDLLVDAFRAGAKGVFCRTEPIEALRKCVNVVYQGQTWINSQQLRRVLEAFATTVALSPVDPQRRVLLTKRENDVAKLIVEAHTSREVATKLGIAEHTVSNYLARIYEKLGISSRVELVLYLLNSSEG